MPDLDSEAVTAAGPLSIGEVLSVLQEEFPDVTISKIRFLESQGLVRPERNASGYRQFAEGDIERLRWILLKQRDNFLPLKVIKRALDRGVDVPDAGSGSQPTLWAAAADEAVEAESARSAAASDNRSGDGTGSGAADDESDDDPDDDEIADDTAADDVTDDTAGDGDDAPGTEVGESDPTVAAGGRRQGGTSGGPQGDRERGGMSSDNEDPETTAGAPGEESSAAQDTAAEARRRHATPADVVAALQEDPRKPRGASSTPSRSRPVAVPRPVDRTATGVQLGVEEFLDSTGISAELLAGLEDYGLVEPVLVGGEPTYDDAAVRVVRAALRCAELGVEPRHLRTFKVSPPEHEAGLIEQVVMPLLKQRNPEARTRAADSARELAELGAEMHAALLGRELGPTLAP